MPPQVWSAVTGKCLRTLVGHTGGVWSSQMVGNIIVSGSTDRYRTCGSSASGAFRLEGLGCLKSPFWRLSKIIKST